MKFKTKAEEFAEKRLSGFWDFCRENRKTAALICAGVLVLCVMELVSSAGRTQYYVKGKNGVEAVVRTEDEQAVALPFRIEAEKNGVKTSLEVILSLNSSSPKQPAGGERKQSPEAAMEKEIKDLIRNLESQESGTIRLPQKTEDGMRLTWSGGESSSLPAILLMAPLSMALLYRSRKDKEKNAEAEFRNGILRQLPGFNNQLLLLLESGLIFSDAFRRIGEGFSVRTDKGPLGNIVLTVLKEAEETGSSLPSALCSRSKNIGIREFSRLSNIISDHQFKGVNLSDKLESESELLWNRRKKLAEERGKAAETKLSFPLAILLLVLILITASPAILQM